MFVRACASACRPSLAAVALAWASIGGAWADEDVAARPEAAAPEAPVAEAPAVTVHVLEEGAGDKTRGTALAAFAEALAKDTRVRYRDLVEILDPPEEGAAALADADQQLSDGQALFTQMDIENARAKIEAAIKQYELRLPELAARDGSVAKLRDAWIRRAAIQFFDGDHDGARDSLRRVFVLDPKTAWSPKVFPPQMKKAVVESRLLFEALGSGKLDVTTDPPGAEVYVNGAPRGISPTTIDDAPAGPSYVSLRRRGWAPLMTVVEVSGAGDEARCDQTLTRFEGDPIGPLAEAVPQPGAVEAPAPVIAAAARLHVPLVVVVMASREAGVTHVAAWLYDARPKRLLRKVEASGETAEAASKAAVDLLDHVRLDGVVEAPPAPKATPRWKVFDERVAAWRGSRYFWPTVGGAAAVVVAVGLGVGLGVGLSSAQGPSGLTPGETVILLGTGR